MAEKLKDVLFSRQKVEYFSKILKEEYPGFHSDEFVDCVCDTNWPGLELKQKMRHTTLCLQRFMPGHFIDAVEILKAVVPKVSGFEALVLPDYVEVYGLDMPEVSLPALGILTKCGSSEFAIRPFLNRYFKKTMEYMLQWSHDEDFRVRRFASEGCRPRLPWGSGVPELKKDPSLILPILETLKNDQELFVRKSVANNLNDISKDHPELVLALCEQWKGKSPRTDWIIKHGCRTLLKKGNTRAMHLFEFTNHGIIRVDRLSFSNLQPSVGETIHVEFELVLETGKKQKIRMEYIIHFIKSSGKTGVKVFQIKETEWSAGIYPVTFKHSFSDLSTRKHYPGEHVIEIVVNGEVKNSGSLFLRQ